MRKFSCFILGLFLVSGSLVRAHSGVVLAQENQPTFRVEKLAENAYCLFGRGGNIGFLVTPEGILVIDDQFENLAPGIIDEIKKVSDQPIRFLVNTHYHGDHTGGNRVFGKFSLIIAHDNVRRRMLSQPAVILETGPRLIEELDSRIADSQKSSEKFLGFLKTKKQFLEYRVRGAIDFKPEEAVPPVLTFASQIKVHLGDDEVQVFHFHRGHTDGDSVVYFPRQKVLHMGDLFFHGNYPFVDREGGGNVGEWVKTIDAILKRVPPDVRIIPGHGVVTGRDELKYFRNYLSDLREEVGKAIRSGKSLEEVIDGIGMERYDKIKPGFMKLENNIDVVFEELKAGD